jgi:hypothetical protein
VKITSDQAGRESMIQVIPGKPNANAALNFPLVSALGSGPPEPLLYHPGKTAGLVPKILLHTVRMPLSCFQEQSGFDLSQVRHVDFVFDQRAKGSVFFADLAFVDSAALAAPCAP